MDVLLANAPVNRRTKHSRMNPPLGLAYIAAVLLENGFSVSAEDFNVGSFTPERAAGILERRAPRILGISASTETYLNGLKLAEIARQVDPGITVVMGGPHASVMYREVLDQSSIDIVVRGEGEYTMLDLARFLVKGEGSLSGISGIAYRENGEVKLTPERPFICDPDELPYPARELFPLPMYDQPGQVLMSRGGCPFNCVFCAVNNIWKGGRRFRDPDKVLGEILHLGETMGIGDIGFSDDTFTLNRERVLSLCAKAKEVQERFTWGWTCTTRADLVDMELLEAMREAGCYRVAYGVETGSQQVLDAISKRITLDQVRAAVRMALDLNMGVLCSFMFPHPWDTEETIREQGRFMNELVEMGATVTLALTTPFPGTDYYARAEELGIKILTDRWDQFDAKHVIIATSNLSEQRLKELLEELIDQVGLRAQFES